MKRVFEEHCEMVANDTSDHDEGPKPPGSAREQDSDTPPYTLVVRHRRGATMQSPYDPDAEYGYKGVGYKVHVTETCNNADQTEIITDYEVHGNCRSDTGKVDDVIGRLDKVDLTPNCLYADAGYPTPQLLHELAERGIDLMAPVNRATLANEAMSRQAFSFDDDGRVSDCPSGHRPIDHRRQDPNGNGRHLHAIFDGQLCRECPKLALCPVRAPNHRAKGCPPTQTVGNFRLDISPALRARDRRWAQQATTEWKDRYKIRAGIEATMSELERAHGVGKLRVRRLPRVHFAVVCKVTACNVKRWLRASALARLETLWRFFFALTRPVGPRDSNSLPANFALRL